MAKAHLLDEVRSHLGDDAGEEGLKANSLGVARDDVGVGRDGGLDLGVGEVDDLCVVVFVDVIVCIRAVLGAATQSIFLITGEAQLLRHVLLLTLPSSLKRLTSSMPGMLVAPSFFTAAMSLRSVSPVVERAGAFFFLLMLPLPPVWADFPPKRLAIIALRASSTSCDSVILYLSGCSGMWSGGVVGGSRVGVKGEGEVRKGPSKRERGFF